MNIAARHGNIYRIALEPDVVVLGLIISIDRLNDRHPDYTTVQVTASKLHEGTFGAVRLNSGDPAFGYVICRDSGMVRQEELKEDLGRLSMESLDNVKKALRLVYGL